MRMLRTWMVACLLAALVVATAGIAAAQTSPRLASERDAPGATLPGTRPTDDADLTRLSFLTLLLRGGWAMIPLGICSLLGLALVIERGLALRRGQVMPQGFVAGLDKVYRGPGDEDKALAYCRERPSSMSRIMAAGIRRLPEGTRSAEQAMVDQGITEVSRLRRNLRMLHGIAAITPTLGLLGTVWGMIRAFEAASRMGLGTHSDALTQGIYEALVATMTGLLIAVPVLMFYYFYLGLVDRAVLEMNDTTQEFLEKKAPVEPRSLDTAAAVETSTVGHNA